MCQSSFLGWGTGGGPSAPTPTSLQCGFLHCTTNIWQTSWQLAIRMQTKAQQSDALTWDRGGLKVRGGWYRSCFGPFLELGQVAETRPSF